jgi:hypothetical protein
LNKRKIPLFLQFLKNSGSFKNIFERLFKLVLSKTDILLGMGKYQSGQLEQTVNLLAYAFVGSNPAFPT